MARSHYNVVRQKLGIIYVALNNIHLIQLLRVLLLKMIYDNVNIWITSYTLLFIYIKACNKVYNYIYTGTLN